MRREGPEFGEHVVSWKTIDAMIDPDLDDPREVKQWHHNDAEAAEMNRLRGLVVAQAAETETVLGVLLNQLGVPVKPRTTTGGLLRQLRDKLGADDHHRWAEELALLDTATVRRNRVVHDRTDIGSVRCDYATGGGEWTTVISFLGEQEADEMSLAGELTLQQQATRCAVVLLHTLGS